MRIILVLSIMIFNNTIYGQNDYKSYNLKCYQARKLTYEKKLDSAICIYKEAFKLVDYVHITNLANVYEVLQTTKDDNFNSYISNLITDYFNENRINKTYSKIIDSLFIEDQRVRSEKYLKALNYINKYSSNVISEENKNAQSLLKEWNQVDSTNINYLLKMITKFGFPSEELIGESYQKAFPILLHFDSDSLNNILKPVINKALLNGDITPEDYAWIIDRRMKIPYYYFIPIGALNLSLSDVNTVNRRRQSIGLRNLFEGIEIIKKNNKFSQKRIY